VSAEANGAMAAGSKIVTKRNQLHVPGFGERIVDNNGARASSFDLADDVHQVVHQDRRVISGRRSPRRRKQHESVKRPLAAILFDSMQETRICESCTFSIASTHNEHVSIRQRCRGMKGALLKIKMERASVKNASFPFDFAVRALAKLDSEKPQTVLGSSMKRGLQNTEGFAFAKSSTAECQQKASPPSS